MRQLLRFLLLCLTLAVVTLPVQAQVAPGVNGVRYSPADLDQMLRPIALYPDPLLAQVLPACAYPGELEAAASWLQNNPHGVGLERQPWDSAVKAVAHYPDVLTMLNQNLAWAATIGQAFVNQERDVMDSVQRLRRLAHTNGFLETTPQQVVNLDADYVTIVPAQPDYLCVPIYDPALVYYPRPYGWAGPGLFFSFGYSCGPWLTCGVDWMGGCVIAYPVGFYWGLGGWGPGINVCLAYNLHYFHDHFYSGRWQAEPSRYRRSQLPASRLNSYRLNNFRGAVPTGNSRLPQWHGNQSPDLRNYSPGHGAGPAPSSLPHPPVTTPSSPASEPGHRTLFDVHNANDVNNFHNRGSQSIQSRPSTTGLPSRPSSGGSRPSFSSPGRSFSSPGRSGGGSSGGGGRHR